ncbi:MAG: hypothetical protein Q8S36_08540 [Sulfuricurvum sp.]|nr:hypothetical protein [Sulfuricurvum sp.]
MGKIDKIKEHIGALKTYLGILVALMVSFGAGIIKLYIDNRVDELFWLGSLIIISLMILFAFIARSMHKNIEKLEDL